MPTIITDTHITTAIAQSNPAARHRDDLLKMELLHLCDVLGVERVERLVANIKRTQQMPHLSPGTSGDPRR